MNGICVAVNATTSVSASSRNTVLKLWKSRPAAPMIRTRRFMARPFRKGVMRGRRRLPALRPGAYSLHVLRGAVLDTARPAIGRDPAERTREMGDADEPIVFARSTQERDAGGGAGHHIDVVVRT